MAEKKENNLATMFQDRVKRFGDQVCMKYKKDGQWIDMSYNEVNNIVHRFALGLLSLGMEAKDNLSLLSENRPEWAFCDLACLSVGGCLVTIYATNTPEQCAYIVKDSESKFVVVSNNNQLEKILSSKSELPQMKKIIIFDPIKDITDKDPMVISFRDVCEMGEKYEKPEEFEERIANVQPDDLLTLIYTSGTTGDPKGVMLTHDNLLSNVEACMKIIPIEDDDIALSFLPLSHSFERMAGHFTMFYNGVPIAYAESIDALVQNIGEIHPTVMVAVPRIYEKVHARILDNVEKGGSSKKAIFQWAIGVGSQVSEYKLKKKPLPFMLNIQYTLAHKLVFSKLHETLGGRLRFFVSGGAPLAQEIAEFFHAAGITILEGYGLTETSPVITVNTPDHMRFGMVGKPVPGVEVKIADDGEILVRGPNVMKGYYNKPEASKEALEDGWFHTGDIGLLDADGFLKITDRKKDLIVTAGGKNVAPQNIENMMKMDKYIEQVNVVGDRRKFLSAVIVPSFEEVGNWAREQGISFKDNKELVANPKVVELIQKGVDAMNNQLAKYETIKKFILAEEEFTQQNNMLTPTLKVKRKVVNKQFAEQIERLYAQ